MSSAARLTPARLLRTSVHAAGLAYAAGVLGYALVRPLLGERHGWIELADDLEPWTYLPAPAVGLLGVLAGSRGLVGAAGAVGAAFGIRWGARYLRRSPSAQPASTADLTVMSFNTLAWQREGHDLVASILSADPDLVGLQEIGPRGAAYLARTLAGRYPYTYVTPSPDSHGAAVLSRFPLAEAASFRVTDTGHWWQRFLVETPRGPVTYLNVHTRIPYVRTTHRRLGLPRLPREFHSERRTAEIRTLVELLDQIDGPVLITGDFNMTERSADHRAVAARLRDAYRAVGRGLGHTFPRLGSFPRTFPAPWPLLRLDYVWHSEHFQPLAAWVGDAGRSDHHPVIVRLRWNEAISSGAARLPLAASTV